MNDLQGFGFIVPHWAYWSWLAIMPLVLMYAVKRAEKNKKEQPLSPAEELALDILAEEDPVLHTEGNKLTKIIDKISDFTGVFIALWTITAVVAYAYEVLMRYAFNMPTIWVHEASF
ncbi:MAG: C4-dicarboxylate ABC transporter permease, partial [Gammaproteobacteria bacterium]|nr:C4-dicarboxylate ABC transporter permease [Gammaproteobacteria bacterium]